MSKRYFKVMGSNVGAEISIGKISEDEFTEYADIEQSELYEYLENNTVGAWDNDNVDHVISPFADGGFSFVEVDENGNEIDEEEEFEGWTLAGRERYMTAEYGYEEQDPVLFIINTEKGYFGHWIVETNGEDFEPKKFAFSVIESNYGEIVDQAWYDKKELYFDQDCYSTTSKSVEAKVGWMECSDTKETLHNNIDEYWESYQENLEDED
jgi:hypothetical protein